MKCPSCQYAGVRHTVMLSSGGATKTVEVDESAPAAVNDNPIEDGNTIAGLMDGNMDSDIKWKVQYEDSLIQPIREVIDINMGEYASGNR